MEDKTLDKSVEETRSKIAQGKLAEIVVKAVHFLTPHFKIRDNEISDRRVGVLLVFRDKKNEYTTERDPDGVPIRTITLTPNVCEGDFVIGHEVGHFLHDVVNPQIFRIPQNYRDLHADLLQCVANYAGLLYPKMPIPHNPRKLLQLARMNLQQASKITTILHEFNEQAYKLEKLALEEAYLKE